jgi:acyl phosphate:glycerol-3-phosphate acyltransferase
MSGFGSGVEAGRRKYHPRHNSLRNGREEETPMLLYILLAFAFGSIPFGLIVVRALLGLDIRTLGSGNIGATNVLRIAGRKAGLLVLASDILKGLLPVLAVSFFYPRSSPAAWSWTAGAVALAAVAGHIYPVYLRFKPSGKGVATALGAYICLAPSACAIALAVFAGLVALTRRVSAGSLGAALVLPAAAWMAGCGPGITLSALAAVGLILLRHKDNIHRLRQGKEPPLTGRHGPPSNKVPSDNGSKPVSKDG